MILANHIPATPIPFVAL